MEKFKIGEVVRTKCTAVGRYIGNGQALFVSAMSNDLGTSEAMKKDENKYDLPLPDDNDLAKYTKKRIEEPQEHHKKEHLVYSDGETLMFDSHCEACEDIPKEKQCQACSCRTRICSSEEHTWNDSQEKQPSNWEQIFRDDFFPCFNKEAKCSRCTNCSLSSVYIEFIRQTLEAQKERIIEWAEKNKYDAAYHGGDHEVEEDLCVDFKDLIKYIKNI